MCSLEESAFLSTSKVSWDPSMDITVVEVPAAASLLGGATPSMRTMTAQDFQVAYATTPCPPANC
jgi:hypothetical protein